LIRKCSLWATLAILIGIVGTGCRESNPAYLPVDAAKDRSALGRADLAIPVDKGAADSEPADLAASDLGNPEADAGVEGRISDAARDRQADLADASVDRTGAADSSRDAGEVLTAWDAADASVDASADAPADVPAEMDDGGSGTDDASENLDADLDANTNGRDRDARVKADAGRKEDAGVVVKPDAARDATDAVERDSSLDTPAIEAAADETMPVEVGASDADLAVDANCVEGSSCTDAGTAEDAPAQYDSQDQLDVGV
jgi:hypothetical protein